ncbi:diguanylate cyclase [Candidatus Methylomicrobium oryzae]|uniref:diguanylate cyclase n=1 Tax=Candidatus Methylomicrobium oryzae TaxID=2802053 RepID=UPI0019227C38|nr:diguanylate cyclase [Methylomicrobium sp. RS1]
MTNLNALYEAVLDSVNQEIAVIDHDGTIVYANRAWQQFGTDNNLKDGVSAGSNYLKVCAVSAAAGDRLAAEVANGIREVASGKRASFSCEYPCHSPNTRRWFIMNVTPLRCGLPFLLVISHQNITERKLMEEQIQFQALHDPMTGLSNRLHFSEVLDKEWRRALRSREPLSLVMLDIDFFKQYNDKFGHLSGDQCLIEVSHILKKFSNRADDLAARYGGEEFVLILGNTAPDAAYHIAESIRKSVYDLEIVYDDVQRITISAGVASFIPNMQLNTLRLLNEADKALYRAKREGRNRVVIGETG